MQIEIVNTTLTDMGKYKKIVCAYRSNGKLNEKTILSFGAQSPAFEVLAKAQPGHFYEVTASKNDKGYWDWTAMTASNGGSDVKAAAVGGNSTPNRSFETAEERADRQKLIVRQSSLSNALEFFKMNTKKTPTLDEVREVADVFVNYVFNRKDATPGMGGILELEDDIPV